ncbi:MAG: SRPBCC domain-containing protein [Rhizobiaceae bacterium]|nr:SRPBCC domain-containing protein [Rhizobiaceae bacterium]
MSDTVKPINKSIDVKCGPEAAFNIFTEQMNSWWPLDGNTISAMNGGVAQSVTLEPRVGGQVYEITADGEREDWARVEVFEPGKRLVLAWHVMSTEEQATKVEVDFVPNGDGTRVELTHKGQFALVQAMATSSTKTGEAIGHLEQARRFAPGTLTEEAALRRLIRIAAENAHEPEGVDVFLNHANAYFRHFSNSVYATDFLRNYGFGIVRTPDEAGEKSLTHLKSVFLGLKKERQVFLIAIVARNAVVLGRLEMGRWASDWLLENVGPGDKLHARIELYQIATSILDAESYADAAERLTKLPIKYLGESDMSLHSALTQLSSRIGSELIDVEKLKELTRIEKQSFPGDEPELPFDVEKEMILAKANPVLMKTEEMLEKADRLLER